MVRKTPSLQGCMVHEIQVFLRKGIEDDMLKLSQFQLEMSTGMVGSVVYTENEGTEQEATRIAVRLGK